MLHYRKIRPRWSPREKDGAGAGTSGSPPRTIAVMDMGASSVRLVVAEIDSSGGIRILEEASRGVLLGKDTFTNGRIGATTLEATLRALEGFRRIMDGYGVKDCRAVATSAVREASNRDSFLDRIRLRTGLDVEVIDGPEEVRLSFIAVRGALEGHVSMTSGASLLVEVGGGSADISLLHDGVAVQSGTYPLGSIRMRQILGTWRGEPEQRLRLMRRHIQNVIEDIRREIPMSEARHFIALGGDVRFAVSRMEPGNGEAKALHEVGREAFLGFCDQVTADDTDRLVETHRLTRADAETLVPALLAYRGLLAESSATTVIVPDASLRDGLLLDLSGGQQAQEMEDLGRQVLSSASALGEKYRYDAVHGKAVATLATRLFDELKPDHGLSPRHRLLLEVAALLHDIGGFVSMRAHHKHTLYLLQASEIFGLSTEDMAIVANVARYHRRGLPAKSHPAYMGLDRMTRVEVLKLAAILRLANALDSDHLQKIRDLRVLREGDEWVLEVDGAGDLTMERLAARARADLFTDVFGRQVGFRTAEMKG